MIEIDSLIVYLQFLMCQLFNSVLCVGSIKIEVTCRRKAKLHLSRGLNDLTVAQLLLISRLREEINITGGGRGLRNNNGNEFILR